MIASGLDRAPRPNAAAFRFLFLCVGGWIVLRTMMLWNPAVPVAPGTAPIPWRGAPPLVPFPQKTGAVGPQRIVEGRWTPGPRPVAPRAVRSLDGPGAAPDMARPAGGFGAGRHDVRLALMMRLFRSRGAMGAVGAAGAMPVAAAYPAPGAAGPRGDPGSGQPFWMRRTLAGWSLAGWSYVREASDGTPGDIAAGGQLGGSQAGLRLAYGFGAGRLRAYGRAVVALRQPRQRELAFGLSYAPVARLPVDIAVERRVAIGRDGRSALAAMLVGGVSDVALPAGFRLDAYAQTGVVGARRRDGFADGALVADRRLGGGDNARLDAGALVAGAVQPGAARLDVGPRLTLRLPAVGQGSRIALDWRQRVAGDARPESGLALTLAADF